MEDIVADLASEKVWFHFRFISILSWVKRNRPSSLGRSGHSLTQGRDARCVHLTPKQILLSNVVKNVSAATLTS